MTSTGDQRQPDGPQHVLQRWLPHCTLFSLMAGALALFLIVLSPLAQPLLMAAAVATLTQPILYRPINQTIAKLLPQLPAGSRRYIASLAATGCVLAAILTPVLLVLLSVVPSLAAVWDFSLGIITDNPEQLQPVYTALTKQLQNLTNLYPSLNLNPQELVQQLAQTIAAGQGLSKTMLSFFMHGSSRLAEWILASICLVVFYVHGGKFACRVFAYTPLDDEQQQAMFKRHTRICWAIIMGSLGKALVKGCLFGLLSWLIGGVAIPPVIIGCLATVLCLLPMVGPTMVWLPLALLASGQGLWGQAVAIAVASIVCNQGVEYLRSHVQKQHLADETWLNFGLFIGLVGGLLSFGFVGLVIGPTAVALVMLLLSHGLSLYSSNRVTAAIPTEAQPRLRDTL